MASKVETVVGVVAGLLLLFFAAGILVSTLMRSRGDSGKVACTSNLREIAKLGMLYADATEGKFSPLGPGDAPAAHESLNVLVDFFAEGSRRLKPDLFICRSWRGMPAGVDEKGKFRLDETSCAYTWSHQRLSPIERAPLSSDKFVRSDSQPNGHAGGMIVVYTDSSSQWVAEEDLGPDGLPEGLTR